MRPKPSNPNAVYWECPECGRTTKANLRTGLAYSHTRPDSSKLCPRSATKAVEATMSGQPPVALGKVRESHAGNRHKTPPLDGAPSTSVRAFRGGLPESNRGRH